MKADDIAMIAFGLALLSAPIFCLALLRKPWRRQALRGLLGSLVVLAVSLAIGVATSPPKEVREAEARGRAALLEQRAKEEAAKIAAENEATRLAGAAKAKEQEIARERAVQLEREAERQRFSAANIERERDARESADRHGGEAAAREARHKQLEAEAIEATKAARASAAARASGGAPNSSGQSGQVGGPKPLVRDLIGCKNRESYDRLAKIAASGDKGALVKLGTSLVLSGTCRSLNAGTLVHLEDTAIFSALMCARPAGDVSCYWMAIDATK